MTFPRLAMLSAAALLIAGAPTPTLAQTSPGSSPGASGSQMKCWDAATNQIRDQMPGSAGSTTPGGTVGSASPGTSPGASLPAPGSRDAPTRPPQAAGLPNC